MGDEHSLRPTGFHVGLGDRSSLTVLNTYTGTTLTDGITIPGAATTGVNISGACTTGISISGACTTGISLTASTTGISIGVSVTKPIEIGAFSNDAGYATPVNQDTNSRAVGIFATDGKSITSGSRRAFWSRFLVLNASSGSTSIMGGESQVVVYASGAHTGQTMGLWAYAEIRSGTHTCGYLCGLHANVDIQTTAVVVDTGCVAASVLCGGQFVVGATYNGQRAAIAVANPNSGYFSNLFHFASADSNYKCGVKVTATVAGESSHDVNADGLIRIVIGTTAYYWPIFTAAKVTNE